MKNMERIELSFRELWKAFTQNEGEEVSEDVDVKEIIENDTTLSEQDKKTLLNSIKNRDKLEKNLFKDSLIVKKNKDDIEKESEKAINKWKRQNSKIPENVLSDSAKKQIAEEKAQKVQEEMEQESGR